MKIKRHFTLLECGHWFRESALSTFDPAANRTRVCAAHVSGSPAPHPEKYARTGQGLPVVPVIRYIDDPEG